MIACKDWKRRRRLDISSKQHFECHFNSQVRSSGCLYLWILVAFRCSSIRKPWPPGAPAGSAQFEVQGLRVTRRCRRGRTARPSGSSPNTCWQCSRPVPKIAADERIVLVLTKSRLGIVSPQVPTALLFFAGQMCRGGGRE